MRSIRSQTLERSSKLLLNSPSTPEDRHEWLGELVDGQCPTCSGPMRRFDQLNGLCWRCCLDQELAHPDKSCACPGAEGGHGGWHYDETGAITERCASYWRGRADVTLHEATGRRIGLVYRKARHEIERGRQSRS